MRTDLPPLDTLPFFEAAARHLSFSAAADELGVTQSAVSYRIARLEAQLGITLFRRLNRALLLTEDGQTYLAEIRPALRRVAEATGRLRRPRPSSTTRGVLSVSVVPSFAAKCLVPRLQSLTEHLPGLDLRLGASIEMVMPGRGGIDCCVRYGTGSWPGAVCDPLGDDDLFPVCSPHFRAALARQPTGPEDLLQLPLLHDVGEASWVDWLGGFGVTASAPTGPTFSDSAMLLQAAIDGAGVALGRSVLAREDLRAGRLVRLLPHARRAAVSFWLVRPPGPPAARVAAFRDWLLHEFFTPIEAGAEEDGQR